MIDELRFSYKPEKIARIPLVPESDAQVMVNFFENEFVAVTVFIEVTANVIYAFVFVGKWLPKVVPVILMNYKYRFTACNFDRFGNFIVGIIGEEREIGIFAAG